MDRRELLGLLGAGTAGLVALGGAEAQEDHTHEHAHSEAEHKHIQVIGQCALLCNEAAHHCLHQLAEGRGDRQHHARAHELAMDCQAFCVLTATLMARGSPLAQYAHGACAEACRCCAEECEKAKEDHDIMRRCAEACRACESTCRAMAKAGGDHDHAAGR